MPIPLTTSSLETAIGRISLDCTEHAVCALHLPGDAVAAPPPAPGSPAERAFRQIAEYLRRERRCFSLPVQLPEDLSPFARQILHSITAIPYGCTATYGSLGPARAVGRICASNPLPLLIPCHRVIPAANPPGNYQGGTELKTRLLNLENALFAPLS